MCFSIVCGLEGLDRTGNVILRRGERGNLFTNSCSYKLQNVYHGQLFLSEKALNIHALKNLSRVYT